MNKKLIAFYTEVRNQTEAICAPLGPEDYNAQPVVFASPLKWQLGHTSWFFETMILAQYASKYEVFDPSFNFLFNSYYNTIGERTDRALRGSITRPNVEEVYAYRKHVDKAMLDFLNTCTKQDVLDLIELGLNHEQQHQELMVTDLKYVFSLNPTLPVYNDQVNYIKQYNSEAGFVSIEEGVYEIGYTGSEFCFDNELGFHKTYIQPFRISKNLVTNGEFIEFIEAGGYSDFNCWLDEGWYWVQDNNIQNPLYWKKHHGDWYHYTLNGLQVVDRDAILCHVSYYEAAAFAQWKGMRLPTEFEWEVASDQLNWGSRWEWTNSAYLPYPNFKIADGAVGEYNGKFMVNQMVLRGASTATAANHSRNTYRNFFHPNFQWQFSGIRLVK